MANHAYRLPVEKFKWADIKGIKKVKLICKDA